MWIAKIKKKKLQFILIFAILLVVAMILSTCVNITNDVKNYISDYYSSAKENILFNYSKDERDYVKEYLETHSMEYLHTVAYSIDENVYLNDKNMSITLGYITVVNDISQNPWDLKMIEGVEKKAPEANEIWVPAIVADSKGINIGDKIQIKSGDNSRQYIVSAFINDALEPTSILGFNNFYINSDIMEIMDESTKVQVYGYDLQGEKGTIEDMESYIGHHIQVSIISKDGISNVAKLSTVAVGGIGLLASILVFIAAIVIIRFILWNSILKEYRSIGIYKAIGFSSRAISRIYLKAYGYTGIIAIIIGSLFSIYLSGGFVKKIVKYVGVYEYNWSNLSVAIGCVLVLSAIYLLTLWSLLRRVKHIKPLEALIVGSKKTELRIQKSIIKNTCNSIALAINDIFKYKKQNILIMLVFVLLSFLSLLFVNIDYSVANIDKNIPKWFGNMVGDVNINTYNHTESYNDIMDFIKQDHRVKDYRYGNYGLSSILSIDSKKYGISNSQIVYCAYNSYEESGGFESYIIEGRNPEHAGELALTQKLMKEAGLKIGETIQINVDGNDQDFLITGSYTSIYNNSYSYRVVLDSIPEKLLPMLPMNIIVNLKNQNDIEDLIKEIEEKYDLVVAEKIPSQIASGLSDLEIISPIVKMILSAVIFFSLLNIINIVVMNKTDNRKSYGIMKAIGFSNLSIILRMVVRIAFISFISMLLGYVLYLRYSNRIFAAAVMGIEGLMKSWNRDFLTLALIMFMIIIASIFSMLSVRRISTLELMEE